MEEAPEFFQANCENIINIDDLLDFSNEEEEDVVVANGGSTLDNAPAGNSTEDSSTMSTTVLDSYNSSSFSGSEPNFNFIDARFSSTHDLSVPYDDLAELEWLSNIQEEESFSTEELQQLQLISGIKAAQQPNQITSITTTGSFSDTNRNNNTNNKNPIFNPDKSSIPAKARSKRSRTGPCKWKSDVVSPPLVPQESSGAGKKATKNSSVEGRKCLHCATDKTPQWRTGPMGPKTLCNACGVRYKSGRLVPEYRPAASPTFVLTKHSNSHRKVLELRRQKEMMSEQQMMMMGQVQQQQQHHGMVFDGLNGEDYLIHQHVGPNFSHMI